MALKIYVKVFIPDYDLQGEEEEVPSLPTRDEWLEFKQTIIEDFISNFKVIFRARYKYHFDKFGFGVYADNEMNRRLHRVGFPYDRGRGFRETLNKILKEKRVRILGEDKIIFSRFWTRKEDEYVAEMMDVKKLYARQIAPRIFRSPSAVYSRRHRIKYKMVKLYG